MSLRPPAPCTLVFLLALAWLAPAPALALAQDAEAVQAAGSPQEPFELTEAALTQLVAEITPAVEKETGTQLEGVAFRLASPDEIQRPFFARYVPTGRAVLVSPAAIRVAADAAEEPRLLEREGVFAALAVEAVRAADDLRFGWGEKLANVTGDEARLAFEALIEGHARLTARGICAASGGEGGFEACLRAFGSLPGGGRLLDAPERYALRAIALEARAAGLAGEAYVRSLLASGDEKALASAFAEPPKVFARLGVGSAGKGTSRPATGPTRNLAGALEVLATGEPLATFRPKRGAFDEGQFRASIGFLPAEEIDRLATALRGNHFLALMPRDNPTSGARSATCYEFASSADALRIVGVTEWRIRGRRQEGQARVAAPIRTEIVERPGLPEQGWVGLLLSRDEPAADKTLKLRVLVVCRGTLALELNVTTLEEAPTREWLEEEAAKVLDGAVPIEAGKR